MGLLDAITSALGGGRKINQNDLLPLIINLIGGQKGGLNGLTEQFTSNGLGDIISSWIGTGKNLKISPDQLQQVLGPDTIKDLALKLNVNTKSVSKSLSDMLPKAVDKLTPEGKIPETDILSQGMDLLGGLFGRK